MTQGAFDEDALGECYDMARSAERAGDISKAAAAYRDCLVLDPADHVGARIRLAGITDMAPPASAGDAYVATLFDQHAESFEDILVRQLRYDVPATLGRRLIAERNHYPRVLDLGCGTGLAGAALRSAAGEIVGVDLSEEMVRVTSERDVYDRLFVAEVVAFLEKHDDPEPYDLIVATDVLPYLGGLDPFLGAAAKRLGRGGTLGVSTETMSEAELAGRPFVVGRDQRFHHGANYVRERMAAHDFEIRCFDEITVRMQEGKPAPGHLIVAHKI